MKKSIRFMENIEVRWLIAGITNGALHCIIYDDRTPYHHGYHGDSEFEAVRKWRLTG